MRTRATWAGLCLAASAWSGATAGCELSRPEGAFTPVYPAQDSGLKAFPDASSEEEGGDIDSMHHLFDAGVKLETENEKYKNLVGYYLARFDEHSSTTSHLGVPVGDVVVKNRVSRYFLIGIREQDGVLKSVEQMCGQEHAHTCTRCEGIPTTRIFPGPAKLIRTSSPIVRDLSLSARGDLAAPDKYTFLGYAGTETDRALPDEDNGVNDPRVWNRGTDEPGLYTELHISIKTPPLGSQSLTCQLGLVQELHLSWNADVGSADAPLLDGVTGTFKSAETDGHIIFARADSNHTEDDCRGKGNGSDSEDTPGDRHVQFKKVDRTTCPSLAEFGKLIPPDAVP